MTDLVNQPSHYKTESGLEVIDMIEQGLVKYDHRDQVLKYVYRAPKKGSALQDLQKAQWYLNRTIQNVIDGKVTFDKIESEPAHEYDRSKVYKDTYGCVWEWFEDFETWAWGTSHDDCLERAEYFNGIPVKYAEPWASEAPYTVVEEVEVEVKPLNSSTIEELLSILTDSVEKENEPEPEFDKDYIYTDSVGDDWEWFPEENTWAWGKTVADRKNRAEHYFRHSTSYNKPWEDFEPYIKKGDAPKYDQAKVCKDKDGDIWECISGAWVTGDTHEERYEAGHEMLEFGDYYTELPDDYAPYTECVEGEIV